jgi:Nif-specific regulatory protein
MEDLEPYLKHGQRADAESQDRQPVGSLRERERRDVLETLERNNWVQTRAARELGITLRQMGYRVKKFGLEEMVKQRRSDAC